MSLHDDAREAAFAAAGLAYRHEVNGALDAALSTLTADGPVILLPDEGDGCKVAKLDDIERLREHTTFIAEDGEVSIRRYQPHEWRYALIDAVRMVAE